MLTLMSGSSAADCAGLVRRDFLRAGVLALGGLSLPWLLSTKAAAAASEPGYVRDKAVVLIFLAGGASCKEPPPSRLVQHTKVISLRGSPARTLSGHSRGSVRQAVLPRSWLLLPVALSPAPADALLSSLTPVPALRPPSHR